MILSKQLTSRLNWFLYETTSLPEIHYIYRLKADTLYTDTYVHTCTRGKVVSFRVNKDSRAANVCHWSRHLLTLMPVFRNNVCQNVIYDL